MATRTAVRAQGTAGDASASEPSGLAMNPSEPAPGPDLAPADRTDEAAGEPSARDPRIERFLRSPARYIDDGWFDTMPDGALLRRLRDTERTRASVSRELLARHALDDAPIAELEDPAVAALCLASSAELRTLVRHAGLVAGSRVLRRVVDGPSVRRIKEAIGADAFRFAIERAQFLAPATALADVPDIDLRELPWAVDRHGLRLLAISCRALPESLNRRIAMKLPVRCAEPFARPFESVAEPDARRIVGRLLRERGIA